MRLLIDTVPCSSPGGLQSQHNLARAVEQRCPPDWDVVFLHGGDERDLRHGDKLRVVTEARPRGWVGLWTWYQRTLPARVRRHGADVLFSLSGILPGSSAHRFPTVNSIQNMLPFTERHIRQFPIWSKDRARLVLLQKLMVSSSKRADTLVFPSQHGVDMVNLYAGDLSDKAYVALNPIPEYARYDAHHPPPHPYDGRPFCFYLSVVFWYKNHLNLIEAYRRADERGIALPDLIMAGPPAEDAYVARMQEAIRAGSFGDRVRYLGKIPQEDIPGWLHHATINVFPSTCETNSFVQGEILGANGVMACSDCAPMPEVAGDAAELFDPDDPDHILDVLHRLSGDPARRQQLRKLAAERARGMTWDAAGEVIWEAVLRAKKSFDARTRNGASP